MTEYLSNYFGLNRRYSRSINLERDFDNIDALHGYIPTERTIEATRRILAGLISNSSQKAWTITSVYGTGKSAFALFLASLFAGDQNAVRHHALEIVETTFQSHSYVYETCREAIPKTGFLRAIAVAKREPLSHTIIRALYHGCQNFWSSGKQKRQVIQKISDLYDQITDGSTTLVGERSTTLVGERSRTITNYGDTLETVDIVSLVKEIAKAAKTNVLLIIDELGKNLEYAVQYQSTGDLYLLQQLAELPNRQNEQVYIIGLLHQSFADYGEKLGSIQRNEWAKIQGRFEDIPFQDAPAQMMRLVGQAINQSEADDFLTTTIHNQASEWLEHLPREIVSGVTNEVLAATYPLHPISSLVLPTLCSRYAQNDRSLFTFLTSYEPFSLQNFLTETIVNFGSGSTTLTNRISRKKKGSTTLTNHGEKLLPSLKLDRVYDYFIESVGIGLASRPNLQKWVEIQTLIADAKHLDEDSLRVLKTIGILNLVTTTGALKATRQLVTLALCDRPGEQNADSWENIIHNLQQKGIITYRRQLDELRIWQGSDFNVDIELNNYRSKEVLPLVQLLSNLRPLSPVVAQRHSYQTGTLRYFERKYIDKSMVGERSRTIDINQLNCISEDADGLICYWLNRKNELPEIPSHTTDGKPLVLVVAEHLDLLEIRIGEYAALTQIKNNAPELQKDGVARLEVRYRLAQAEQLLDEVLLQSFAVTECDCWLEGKITKINSISNFNSQLSDVCDRTYHQKFVLWNELINRRELSSQGSGARRKLVSAMLTDGLQERLGLEGYGPEVSMYYSVLAESEIHRQEGGIWGFYPPHQKSGLLSVWEAIENFCFSANEKQRNLSELYQLLSSPPYGVKQGVIPVLLTAVLLHHFDDVGVYQEGNFIPILTVPNLEILLKDHRLFSVKYFEILGVRSIVFKELESILKNPNSSLPSEARNSTLLTVVRPLFQFVKRLPKYTKNTKNLSPEALAVLQALDKIREPDELIFTALPQACGLEPINPGSLSLTNDENIAKNLRQKLVQALREIQTAYDQLLTNCQSLLYEAFAVRSGETKLREDLRVRAKYLEGQAIESFLRRFIIAAADENKDDYQWLEALVMIVADKPAESWNDNDATGFALKLNDLARRFKNLEALQKETAAKGDGFEARRITLTRPDGHEINQVVWVDRDAESQIDRLVDEILNNPLLRNNSQLQMAFLVKLNEKILGNTEGKNVKKMENFLANSEVRKRESS